MPQMDVVTQQNAALAADAVHESPRQTKKALLCRAFLVRRILRPEYRLNYFSLVSL